MTHPSQPPLPNVKEISSGVAAAVLRQWQGRDHYDGEIRDDQGRDYLFRISKLTLGEQYSVNILLLAAQEDFVQGVRKLQLTGLILAIIAGAAFVPVIWIFGGRMSRSLKSITAQAVKLQNLAAPDTSPVTSYVKEIHELGSTVNLAQRAIWSFARFVPKEIVRRVLDNSISTELGGVREEITVVFTDVRDFTTIAEFDRPRHPHAPDIPLFLRAHGSFPCRRRNRRQVHWRRRDGVLERTRIRSPTTSSGLAGQPLRANWRAKNSTLNLRPRV